MAGWLSQASATSTVADEAAASLGPANDEPGFFDNALTATGESLLKGGAAAGQTLAMAGAVVPIAIDAFMGNEIGNGPSLVGSYFRSMDDLTGDAIRHWTPDSRTTGTAGRVFGGIAEFAVPLLAGGGNPLATAITTSAQATTATGADLAREGATGAQAGGVAAVQGLANLVGAGFAMRGTTAVRRAAFGAGSNVAINMPADAASAAILEGSESAGRFDPLSVESRAIDLVVGALFGAMARPDAPPPKTADLDAALVIQQQQHAQFDTAPGKIETPAAARAQMDNIEAAQRSLLEGTDVPEPKPVTVAPDPVREQQAASRAAAIDEEIAVQRDLFGDIVAPDAVTAPEPRPAQAAVAAADAAPGRTDADPAVAALRQAVDSSPDMPVALVDDPDAPDAVRRVTAREALDEIDAQAKTDDELAGGFNAAINCFLSGGA